MKPCPFCGERVKIVFRTTRDLFNKVLGVEYGLLCSHCGALVYFQDHTDMAEAMECWEKRVDE